MTDLNKVGQLEIKTQERVLNFMQAYLQYDYLGNREDREDNSHIEEDLLRKFLTKTEKYSNKTIEKAIAKIVKIADDQTKSLYDINKEVYRELRYGVKVRPDVGENSETVRLIDWKNPKTNHFAVAEEVTIKGQHTKRPDIVIYVNGIALGVIELKRSKVSVHEGIRQNLDNQKEMFIKQFFAPMQLVMAGNDTEGIRYGTIETPEKYFLTWKEDSEIWNILDRHVAQMCGKERFLEIIHDFIVFDKWVKKLCRHNQFFGVKASQESLRNREGGVIWHTQWSGKSLTMVRLTKRIIENVTDSRVLIITDREELDDQIEKVFKWIQEDIYRTKSGRDLIKTLNHKDERLVCSLIHKFWNKAKTDDELFIEELKSSLPKDFEAKGDIYVFVDECHRTQSWKLHDAMQMLLPNALFIWFTWTPLLKKDKQTSLETWGKYIHTYKFDEAVNDGVILDLRYEARDIDQKITSQDKIDQRFDVKTRGLTDYARMQLKKKRWTLQKVFSSKSRLEKIISDILLDFETKERLQNGFGNAMLVAGSIYQACKYYELFQEKWFKKCAIISSYNPHVSSIKWESTGGDEETEGLEKYAIYQKMLDGKEADVFTAEVKKKFIEEPWQMKLLIVVDKLLTWFDAPSATYLYIDKSMRDHGLFQAICRVNRLDDDSKEYGYIIDYKDLFRKVKDAIDDYTVGAFDNFEHEDIAGLLSDRLEKAKERLDEALETVRALCEGVPVPKSTTDYIHYFCGESTIIDGINLTEQKRHNLYKHVVSLIRAFANIANEMLDAGYTQEQENSIREEVRYYTNIRDEIKLASGDYIDLKAYEHAMRHLIDSYISSEDSQKISAFDDTSLLELIVERWVDAIKELPASIREDNTAVAETIENNLRKLIIDEQDTNPKYYDKMSELLEELIKRRREEAITYQEYLKSVVDFTKRVRDPGTDTSHPSTMNTNALRSLYDNLDKDEVLASAVDHAVRRSKQHNFRGSKIKERMIKNAIVESLKDFGGLEWIDITSLMEIIKNQKEY